MRQLLEILWSAVSGWIPWPQWSMEVAPEVFYPLFGVLVIALVWSQYHEFREHHRQAVAQGSGPLHLWATLITLAVIGGIGYFFITG